MLQAKELCPRCGNEMVPKKKSLRIKGTYVGNYDAMSCPICRYYYFTDSEYDLALDDARSLGLVGPPSPHITSIIASEPITVYPSLPMSTNSVAVQGNLTMNVEASNPPTIQPTIQISIHEEKKV